MEEFWQRVVDNLVGRLHGPMQFRLFLQPLMAVILAFIDGKKDAALNKPAYGWTLLANPSKRKELMREGWKRVRNVFILACVLDVGYGLAVLGMVYPGETLVVAFLLAIVPYYLFRGLINRIFTFVKQRR